LARRFEGEGAPQNSPLRFNGTYCSTPWNQIIEKADVHGTAGPVLELISRPVVRVTSMTSRSTVAAGPGWGGGPGWGRNCWRDRWGRLHCRWWFPTTCLEGADGSRSSGCPLSAKADTGAIFARVLGIFLNPKS